MHEEISFGVWVRKQRRALDLSRQSFADQVGCAEVTLRRIEVVNHLNPFVGMFKPHATCNQNDSCKTDQQILSVTQICILGRSGNFANYKRKVKA